MKLPKLWIILAIMGGILLLGLLLFPPRNQQQVGSTFGKTPDGYGAWYAYMKSQDYTMQQLQKSEATFLQNPPSKSTTLLRVYPDFSYGLISEELEKWIKQGNRLVLVGIRTAATEAPFRSDFNTDQGIVTIETKRRLEKHMKTFTLYAQRRPLLADDHGLVVWESSLEKGKIIFVATPYLAANAYQNQGGNFAYLAHLVDGPNNTIVVDEYLHGYIDKEELVQTTDLRDWFSYLMQTPLAILGIQLALGLLLFLWAQNRRFGNIMPVLSPKPNNNLDYIDALSEVLFKAETHSFLINKITKAEQIYLQQKLGLGTAPLPLDLLARSWQQQGKGNGQEILTALQVNPSPRGVQPLFQWLKHLARLRTKLS